MQNLARQARKCSGGHRPSPSFITLTVDKRIRSEITVPTALPWATSSILHFLPPAPIVGTAYIASSIPMNSPHKEVRTASGALHPIRKMLQPRSLQVHDREPAHHSESRAIRIRWHSCRARAHCHSDWSEAKWRNLAPNEPCPGFGAGLHNRLGRHRFEAAPTKTGRRAPLRPDLSTSRCSRRDDKSKAAWPQKWRLAVALESSAVCHTHLWTDANRNSCCPARRDLVQIGGFGSAFS